LTLRERFANGPNWGIVIVLLSVHLIALAGAPFVLSREGLVVMLVMYFVTGFGVTVGYHRRLTHRSYGAPQWLDRVLAVLGLLSGEGPPIFWVAHHRKHHGFSDQPDDPHSPRAGFWWAHCLWMMPRKSQAELGLLYRRWAPELLKDRFLLFLESSYLLWHFLLAALFFVVGQQIGGWRMGVSLVIYGVFVRMVLVLNSTWLVNSACHVWGYQNHETGDNSRNNPFVGLVALGEGWHNNHHFMQNTANHGQRWWEFDLSFLVILILAGLSWPFKKLGLEKWRPVHTLRVHFRESGTAIWFS
jgi:fatty-acid desaturase